MSHAGTVVFGSTPIEYAIRRTNRRKTIAITVRPDLSVWVAVPRATRRTLITKRVRKKAEWIIRQQERLRRSGRRAQKDFVSGESFRYLGRQYQLKVYRRSSASPRPRAAMVHGYLVISVPRRWSSEKQRQIVKSALVDWYRDRATEQIHYVVRHFGARLGVAVKTVDVREMKTRWGSSGKDARLRFHWRIVLAPRRLLEYVVAHELCHIRYHDHSRNFWRLLSSIMPDFQLRRSELEQIGSQLEFS